MSDCFFNPFSSRELTFGPLDSSVWEYHTSFPGYKESPLHSLPTLDRKIGIGRLWVKDESHRFGLPAFKVLGASWAVYRALLDRFGISASECPTLAALKERLKDLAHIRLVCATDGNHGRAVAFMARSLNVPASIYMPAGSAEARVEAVRSEGAEVFVGGTYDDAVARAINELGSDGLLIQDASEKERDPIPEWIIEGYSTLFWEVDQQLRRTGEDPPSVVFVQIGVGSLAHAVVRHVRSEWEKSRVQIVGVEPMKAACLFASMKAGKIVTLEGHQDSIMAGLNCGTPSALSFPILQKGINCLLTVSDDRAWEAMRILAEEGIVAGEKGAAGMAGLIELMSGEENSDVRRSLGLNSDTNVLVLNTEGATDPASYGRIVGKSPTAVAALHQ